MIFTQENAGIEESLVIVRQMKIAGGRREDKRNAQYLNGIARQRPSTEGQKFVVETAVAWKWCKSFYDATDICITYRITNNFTGTSLLFHIQRCTKDKRVHYTRNMERQNVNINT